MLNFLLKTMIALPLLAFHIGLGAMSNIILSSFLMLFVTVPFINAVFNCIDEDL